MREANEGFGERQFLLGDEYRWRSDDDVTLRSNILTMTVLTTRATIKD